VADSKNTQATVYEIIVNDEHQYTVWPTRGPLPKGWRHIGKSGTRAELEAFLKEMFVETRPAPFVVIGRRTPSADSLGNS
jgi:MbtH protein